MRLIFDSDVTNALQKNREKFGVLAMPIEDVIRNIISNLPTIDAVPVVRCKDCIFYEREAEGEEWGFCECAEVKMPQMGFCSDAERKVEQ